MKMKKWSFGKRKQHSLETKITCFHLMNGGYTIMTTEEILEKYYEENYVNNVRELKVLEELAYSKNLSKISVKEKVLLEENGYLFQLDSLDAYSCNPYWYRITKGKGTIDILKIDD